MLPGDPTMGELPDEMPPPFDTDGLEMEEIDWGSWDHQKLMAWTSESINGNTNAHLSHNPPGVAVGRQAFITGLLSLRCASSQSFRNFSSASAFACMTMKSGQNSPASPRLIIKVAGAWLVPRE